MNEWSQYLPCIIGYIALNLLPYVMVFLFKRQKRNQVEINWKKVPERIKPIPSWDFTIAIIVILLGIGIFSWLRFRELPVGVVAFYTFIFVPLLGHTWIPAWLYRMSSEITSGTLLQVTQRTQEVTDVDGRVVDRYLVIDVYIELSKSGKRTLFKATVDEKLSSKLAFYKLGRKGSQILVSHHPIFRRIALIEGEF